MARKVSIPFAFGRGDRADPKFAPFGTLRSATNLRVQKDGRLASRKGYQPLTMTDHAGSTMVAYDLHEFSSGRLCAFGASRGEGCPVDIYEYRGVPTSRPWLASDSTTTRRQTLTPFTYPRQVGGIPQPSQGVSAVDCAAGLGYVCTVYRPARTGVNSYVQIIRESDDQVIFARSFDAEAWSEARVCFAVDRFYFLGIVDGASSDIELGSFVPGTSTDVSTLATVATGLTLAAGIVALDIEAVSNPTNSAVIVAYATHAGTTVDVKRYNSSGSQQGSTLTITTLTEPRTVGVNADEADNTVALVIGQHSSSVVSGVTLRTYDFANSLIAGPTSCNTGYLAAVCRLPAQSGWVEAVAVVSSDSQNPQGDLVIEWFNIDTHASIDSAIIGNAQLATQVVAAPVTGIPSAVVFGGVVGIETASQTNAIWRVDRDMIHMATRDLRASAGAPQFAFSPLGITRDASTGKVAWASLYSSGTDVESFTITTLETNGFRRRQAANSGGQLYIAGAPAQAYDGRAPSEVGFNEVPGIRSISQSTNGSLSLLATYSFIVAFEFTYPDGTFAVSPPSLPVDVTLTGSNDEAVVTVAGPHSARVALGEATMGAQVTGVLYRTVWDSVTSTQSSTFHEVKRFSCRARFASYGDDISVNDTLSDVSAAEQAVLYTQEGPVESNAPEMCAYISGSSSRLTVGGLPRQSEVQESIELPIDQAVPFSGLSAFFTRCPEPVVGLVSLDGVRLVMSRTDVYGIQGEGPSDDGSGALPPPVTLGSPSGLRDWRSLLVAPDGVWAQMDDDKLYRIPRAGGAPEWLGIDVQDTLAAFPVITGAARCRQDDAIAFACETSAGTSGRIVVRSLRTGIWTEDAPPLETSQGIEALCSYGDRVAYVSGGVVYAQSESGYTDGASSVIVTEWQTEPIYPFELGGNGLIHDLQVTGEFRSAGTLALRVSYDDGVSFETYDSFALTGTAGDTVKRRWSLRRSDIQNIVVELVYTPSAPGEGLIINQLTMLADPSNGLEDLDPAEMGC